MFSTLNPKKKSNVFWVRFFWEVFCIHHFCPNNLFPTLDLWFPTLDLWFPTLDLWIRPKDSTNRWVGFPRWCELILPLLAAWWKSGSDRIPTGLEDGFLIGTQLPLNGIMWSFLGGYFFTKPDISSLQFPPDSSQNEKSWLKPEMDRKSPSPYIWWYVSKSTPWFFFGILQVAGEIHGYDRHPLKYVYCMYIHYIYI